ncbi:OmpA family protein [Paraburkholderia megapolitana]|uniref:OmpA family protein n=1 Tax=Paraburkholderia megapolitana TaxID=420953 RepID=UPI0038B7D2D9
MKNNLIYTLFASGLMAMLAGCAGNNPAGSFPDVKSATMAEGIFVNVDNLRNVDAGLSKDQVYNLIGAPHFNESVFGVRTWNYLFNFRSADQVVSCQYQVAFGEDKKVSGVQWRDPSCADFLHTSSTPITPKIEKQVEVENVEQLTMRSDALFPFGKSDLDDMQPDGLEALDNLVTHIGKYNKLVRVHIVGHTDRIGSLSSNYKLSLARATAVRNFLVSKGVNRHLVSVAGVGSSQPVSHCGPGNGSSAIACLAPDRRVSVSITGVM